MPPAKADHRWLPDASRHQAVSILSGWRARGESAALVMITGIRGPSSRSVGALMAVHAEGAVAGSISGGCFDAAVINEARLVLADGQPRRLLLGVGSPWIDIKLPCGGGMELLILPDPDAGVLAEAEAAISGRRPFTFKLDDSDGRSFDLSVAPRLRMLIAGNGGEVAALASLAVGMDAEVVVASSEQSLLASLEAHCERVFLRTPDALDELPLDRWTAVAIFFHDHDWEPPLLARALQSDAFFVGAMGSKATHDTRLVALAALGLSPETIGRLQYPFGLFGRARDPKAIALSALAQIVAMQQ